MDLLWVGQKLHKQAGSATWIEKLECIYAELIYSLKNYRFFIGINGFMKNLLWNLSKAEKVL